MKKNIFLFCFLILTISVSGQLQVISNGNVGIGTGSPSNTQGFHKVLDVLGSQHSKILATSTSGSVKTGIFAHYSWYGGGGLMGTESNHNLHLVTNLNPRLTILANGNTGIGTTNPSKKFQVTGHSYFDCAPANSGLYIENYLTTAPIMIMSHF